MSKRVLARAKRLAFQSLKVVVGLSAALALLAALAYKNVIPGGPWLVETAEQARARWRSYTYRRDADDVPAGTVVFLGSSSIAAFPFAFYFPGSPWLNRGLPAETAHELAERVEETLPVASPSGVVIWTGMNDLRSEAQPPEVVIERVLKIADLVRARFPDVPIAIVEIPPQCDTTPLGVSRLRELNNQLREAALQRSMSFVRTARPPLVNEAGQLVPGAARPDRKHLNLVGNGIVAQWILEDGGLATKALSRP